MVEVLRGETEVVVALEYLFDRLLNYDLRNKMNVIRTWRAPYPTAPRRGAPVDGHRRGTPDGFWSRVS